MKNGEGNLGLQILEFGDSLKNEVSKGKIVG